MPGDDGFERFGKPDRFALDVRLLPDPDADSAAPESSVGSWGEWRLWVGGINLAEHDLTLASGEVVRRDRIAWYLAPLLRWLATSWTALLHEERLPAVVPRAANARAAYLSIAGARMDDAEAFAPWQTWASRHGLRWAAEGGLLPDVFMRRLGDDVEISWGDRWQPGGEAAEYVIEPGVAQCDVADVVASLDGMLLWAAREQSWSGHAWHRQIRRLVAARPRDRKAETALAWYLDGKARPGRLTRLFHASVKTLGAKGRFLSGGGFQSHAMTRLSPAAAMFGALSPKISEAAATRLLAIAASSRKTADAARPLDQYVRESPAWRAAEPWEDGYRLALDLLDELPAGDGRGGFDLDELLERWQIALHDQPLGENGPLGVALAGSDLAPTIVVNTDHPTNHHAHGQRFTRAHELCHLLYDRDRARRVAHSSTPWAPVAVERRANAFAAMLLMPPAAVREAFHPRRKRATLAEVGAMAQHLRVGLRAAIQHLANLGEISEEDRSRLLDEAAERAFPEAGVPPG